MIKQINLMTILALFTLIAGCSDKNEDVTATPTYTIKFVEVKSTTSPFKIQKITAEYIPTNPEKSFIATQYDSLLYKGYFEVRGEVITVNDCESAKKEARNSANEKLLSNVMQAIGEFSGGNSKLIPHSELGGITTESGSYENSLLSSKCN